MTNSKKADPSATFSDSISLFTRSATKAFNDLQTQVRAEVVRVEADAQAARNERDQALNQLQESKKEVQRHKEEILKCKAALKESELTVQHHIENYALLQRETTQWKDQAKNWQDHFLRVEQERCSLSSRMDELVTERLIISPLARNSKHTPSSHANIPQPPTYHSAAPPSASNGACPSSESPIVQQKSRTTGGRTTKHKAKVPSQSELPPYTETVSTPHKVQTSASNSVPRPRTNRKQTTTSSSSAKPAISATEVPKESQEPKQIFIRRVRAIVEVKQEEDSDQDIIEEPLLTPRRSRNGRRVRKIVEDDDYVPEDVSPEIGSGDFEEEDDELMIGAGDDLSFDVSSSVPGQATRMAVNKKRKLSAATSSSKPKARRKT
ncbi:hypothetical protein P691DRAFT_770230 [Macrolepiota fuliginosa MF-IS2]|uniref:Uncharacterized protein n=1 Tax=Macrolepiota fuliginosa MF-IS2 TaxID=1400762 RepID=A0A9P5XQ58_9AGAR|nr:hypothetical protein P691DRAFT_770230 [Macrolepiota fuliginosa MF-IS2]